MTSRTVVIRISMSISRNRPMCGKWSTWYISIRERVMTAGSTCAGRQVLTWGTGDLLFMVMTATGKLAIIPWFGTVNGGCWPV